MDPTVTDTRAGLEPCEAAAEHMLARARLDGVAAPPVRAVVAALGWRLSAGVPQGAHGWLDLETATAHVDDRGERSAVNRRIAHELGHLAAMLACLDHDERDADTIAAAVAVPRRWLRQTVMALGWDAPALIGRYPDAQPVEVLTRAARHAGGVAVVYMAGVRVTAVAGEATGVQILHGERALMTATRDTGRHQHDRRTGLHGWPLATELGPAVVLLGALDDSDLG